MSFHRFVVSVRGKYATDCVAFIPEGTIYDLDYWLIVGQALIIDVPKARLELNWEAGATR